MLGVRLQHLRFEKSFCRFKGPQLLQVFISLNVLGLQLVLNHLQLLGSQLQTDNAHANAWAHPRCLWGSASQPAHDWRKVSGKRRTTGAARPKWTLLRVAHMIQGVAKGCGLFFMMTHPCSYASTLCTVCTI